MLTRLTEQIKTGDEIKKQIRQRLDSKIPRLIGGLNDLLNRADVEVQRAGKKAVAVIVDNLDRVTRKDLGDGRTSHDALFVEHGDQLCALRCHTIYTVPISMMYGLSARDLGGIFDRAQVLPMIKSHEPQVRGGGPSDAKVKPWHCTIWVVRHKNRGKWRRHTAYTTRVWRSRRGSATSATLPAFCMN